MSASQLLKSPRAYWLEKRHENELSADASQSIWSALGTGFHAVMEAGESDNAIVEEFFLDKFKNGSVSGMADLFEDGYVNDYKTTSVWAVINLDDEKKAEWASQLNYYGYEYRKKGFKVKGLRIIMILRDWSKSKAMQESSYPQSQVIVVNIPMFTDAQVEDYLNRQLENVKKYADVPDDKLPPCSDSYRWVKGSEWKVYKGTNKTACRGGAHLKTKEDAEEFAKKQDAKYKYRIEHKDGEQWKRCEYCSARKFCNQTGYREQEVKEIKPIQVSLNFEKFMKITGEE